MVMTHGHDKISICVLKIWGTSIFKPLRLTSNHCLDNGIYIYVRVEKCCSANSQKRWQTNFKLSSFVSTSNVQLNFWRLLYYEKFGFFLDKVLISANKSGDICINQLLSTYNIYIFDDGYEVRGVYLDTSKAFDDVWHNGLIFKL